MIDKPYIIALVAEHFGLNRVNEQDYLVDDLGGDQLDVIELVMLLEEKFNISIDDDEAENLVTVQDIYNIVVNKKVNLNAPV